MISRLCGSSSTSSMEAIFFAIVRMSLDERKGEGDEVYAGY